MKREGKSAVKKHFSFGKKALAVFCTAVLLLTSLAVVPAAALPLGDDLTFGHISEFKYLQDHYRDALDKAAKDFYDLKTKSDIRDFQVPFEYAQDFYNAVLHTHPELFYVCGDFFGRVKRNGRYYISSLNAHWAKTIYDADGDPVDEVRYTDQQVLKMRGEFRSRAQWYLDKLDDNMSDFQKALILHDELALNGSYLLSGEIYEFMVEGKGKCYGYSEVYSYLLAQAGINSEIVESEDMFHQWNKVEIDGVYYHVDVTWDDPTPDLPGFVHHNYFLLSDEAIQNDDLNPHYGYATDFPSRDTRYDNMRYHKIDTQLCYVGNGCYVVDNNYPQNSETAKNLLVYDINADSFEIVQSFEEEYWDAGGGFVFAKTFMSLQEYDGYLYMNTENNVYVYDTRTHELQEFAKNTFSKSFYGLRIIDGKVYAVLANQPGETGSLQYVADCLIHKEEPTTEEPTTEEPTTEEPTTEEPTTEEPTTEEPTTEEPTTEEPTTEEPTTEEPTTEEPTTVEPTTEEPTTEEPTTEEPTTEEPTTEEPTTVEPTTVEPTTVEPTTEEPTTEEPTTEPVPEDTYLVAGTPAEIFGTIWDTNNESNRMEKDGDVYTKTYTVDSAHNAVQLKVVKNGEEWIGDETDNNVTFRILAPGTFTVTYDPSSKRITVSGESVRMGSKFSIGDPVYVAGNGEGRWLYGTDWDTGYYGNQMAKVADGIYEISYTDVPDAVYNGSNITFDTDDICTVKIQLDLREFDFETKLGAKFTLTIEYEPEDAYIVAGSHAEIFGTVWDGGNQDNLMEPDGDVYTKTYTVDRAYTDVRLRVSKNGAEWFGDESGEMVVFNLTGAGTFTVTYDPGEQVVSVSGDIVEKLPLFGPDFSVFVAGSGTDWNPGYLPNQMTAVADGVFELTLEHMPEHYLHEVCFCIDGAWMHNFGGTFAESGAETDAVYNGEPISVDTDRPGTATLRLDLRNFDFATKEGAKFSITVEYDPLIGDIDGSGEVTINDVTNLQGALAEFEELTDEQRALADVNRDGRLNVKDVTEIQRYLAGVIDFLE